VHLMAMAVAGGAILGRETSVLKGQMLVLFASSFFSLPRNFLVATQVDVLRCLAC
jgi:hypothetical protein